MLKRITFVLALAAALPAFAAAEAWKNVAMIDTQCSQKAKANPDAHTKDCALMCAKSGFGIVDGSGDYLKFDDNGNQEALKALQSSSKKDHIRVNVSGKKDGNVIHVQSLSLL
jgi:hypothetical protein